MSTSTSTNTDPMIAHVHGYQFTGSKEQACLDYVQANAKQGDIQSVISAIDKFSEAEDGNWMMNVGPEKGAVLDAEVQKVIASKQQTGAATGPAVVLELGCYVGYSALRMVAAGGKDVKLISVDPSPISQHIAKKMWEIAGITGQQVTLLQGTLSQLLDLDAADLKSPFSLVFIDHEKTAYYTDLKLLEKHGLIEVGTSVVCDNMVGFRTEDLAEYLGIADNAAKSEDYSVSMYDAKIGPTQNRDDAVVVATRVTPVRQQV